MKDMIENDIKDASIQLSHMIYNDNGNFLWLAGQTDSDSVSERNEMTEQLEEAFQIAASPKQDIVSMKMYMKDGRSTYIVIMLSTVIIYAFFQKYILSGIAAGAVKG